MENLPYDIRVVLYEKWVYKFNKEHIKDFFKVNFDLNDTIYNYLDGKYLNYLEVVYNYIHGTETLENVADLVNRMCRASRFLRRRESLFSTIVAYVAVCYIDDSSLREISLNRLDYILGEDLVPSELETHSKTFSKIQRYLSDARSLEYVKKNKIF
jgi:hypothetical protein